MSLVSTAQVRLSSGLCLCGCVWVWGGCGVGGWGGVTWSQQRPDRVCTARGIYGGIERICN